MLLNSARYNVHLHGHCTMAASGHSMAPPKCVLSRSRRLTSLAARNTRYNVHLHGHCTMAASGHSMAPPKCVLSRSRRLASLTARKTRYNVHLHGHCTIKSLKIHLLRISIWCRQASPSNTVSKALSWPAWVLSAPSPVKRLLPTEHTAPLR